MAKPLIFISHITEEKAIAIALKNLIEQTFLGMVEVFVSSDPSSVNLGRKWLDQITQALKACNIEIILASEESIKRPWINFEAGSGYIRDIQVVPLCHSGVTRSTLPMPHNYLQAANANDADELKTLIGVIAKLAGSTVPTVKFTKFIEVVKQFEQDTKTIKGVAPKGTSESGDLIDSEVEVMYSIADLLNFPNDKIEFHRLRGVMTGKSFANYLTVLSLKMLERKDFIDYDITSDGNYNQSPVVGITEAGWNWLQKRHTQGGSWYVHASGDSTPKNAEKKGTVADAGESEINENDIPF